MKLFLSKGRSRVQCPSSNVKLEGSAERESSQEQSTRKRKDSHDALQTLQNMVMLRALQAIWLKKSAKSASVMSIHYDAIGAAWVPRFLACHSELTSIRRKGITATRIMDASLERLNK